MTTNFSSIQSGREDLILKLAMAARQDKSGVNLVAGVPMNPDGTTLVFDCLHKARAALPTDNSYGPIAGLPELIQLTEQDIFGSDSKRLSAGHISSVITPGGTGALFTAGRLLQKSSYANSPIFCPELTWDNHSTVFTNLGFTFQQTLNYQRNSAGIVDFERFVGSLKAMPSQSILLIQGAGNNPGGFDFNLEQILEIGKTCQSKSIMLIYDFAYQQLGQGFEADTNPIRQLVDQLGLNFILSYSFSKRYGTFGQRAGMISVICENSDSAAKVKSRLMESNRACFSNPPRYPQELVLWVKKNMAHEHFAEVEKLRKRSIAERKLFVSGMQQRGFDYSYMNNDSGMFIFLDNVSQQQAELLKTEHHIHAVPWRGLNDAHLGLRLNALGLGEHNRERLMDALAVVLKG